MLQPWVILSFICAFSLATSDALAKKALRPDNEYVIAWLRLLYALPVLILLLFITPTPKIDREFILAFLIALPLEIVAMVLYVKALRLSPLSLTLPFLSLTPMFLIIFSWLILGEKVSAAGAAGILLIAAGGYTLNISSLREGFMSPFKAIVKERGSLYMVIVSLIYGFTASFGKLAITHSSPSFFGATYFMALTVLFLPLVSLKQRERPIIKLISRNAKAAALPGILYSVMVVTHMYAVSLANVAYMISIKRLSLLIGSLYGFLFFGEKNVRERLAGALLMFAGFALIVLYQ